MTKRFSSLSPGALRHIMILDGSLSTVCLERFLSGYFNFLKAFPRIFMIAEIQEEKIIAEAFESQDNSGLD